MADAGDLHIYDETDSAFRFTINTDGNIGIGTTSPGAKLEVKGKTRVRQSAMGDGFDAAPTTITVYTAWTDLYQMGQGEKGIYLASGSSGYGPSTVLHIHFNYVGAPAPGYINVISSGGDTSGYSMTYQLTATGMVQGSCNIDNGRAIAFTKIGGFSAY